MGYYIIGYNYMVQCTINLDTLGLECGYTGISQAICCVGVSENGG